MLAQDGPKLLSFSHTMYGSIESKSLLLPRTLWRQKQVAETEALVGSGSMECLVSSTVRYRKN